MQSVLSSVFGLHSKRKKRKLKSNCHIKWKYQSNTYTADILVACISRQTINMVFVEVSTGITKIEHQPWNPSGSFISHANVQRLIISTQMQSICCFDLRTFSKKHSFILTKRSKCDACFRYFRDECEKAAVAKYWFLQYLHKVKLSVIDSIFMKIQKIS